MTDFKKPSLLEDVPLTASSHTEDRQAKNLSRVDPAELARLRKIESEENQSRREDWITFAAHAIAAARKDMDRESNYGNPVMIACWAAEYADAMILELEKRFGK